MYNKILVRTSKSALGAHGYYLILSALIGGRPPVKVPRPLLPSSSSRNNEVFYTRLITPGTVRVVLQNC